LVTSIAGPDLWTRFERLAAVLTHQPFPDGIEQRFQARWTELRLLWEADGLGTPPLLRFGIDYRIEPIWPKGWR
jgi:hypothetical protein